MKKLYCLAFLAVLLPGDRVFGDEAFRLRVTLQVATADTRVKAEFQSYVRRELRALNDVEIVETNAHFIIRVQPFDLGKEKTSPILGYCIATITAISGTEAIRNRYGISDVSSKEQRQVLDDSIIILEQALSTTPYDLVGDHFRREIARIDTKFFEDKRRQQKLKGKP